MGEKRGKPSELAWKMAFGGHPKQIKAQASKIKQEQKRQVIGETTATTINETISTTKQEQEQGPKQEQQQTTTTGFYSLQRKR